MKIALIGYGKMGKMIEQIAKDRGHEIVCVIDIDNQQDFDSPEFASADVAIEFTAPQAAYGNYLRAFSHNVKVVSGSTGWMKEHGDDVRATTGSMSPNDEGCADAHEGSTDDAGHDEIVRHIKLSAKHLGRIESLQSLGICEGQRCHEVHHQGSGKSGDERLKT